MKDWRYQWSSKLDNGEIYVVHADTREDLEDEIIYVKSLTTNNFGVDDATGGSRQFYDDGTAITPTPFVDHTELSSHCDIHNVEMKERNGKNGKFYSHSKGKYPDLLWCSGKGYPDETQNIS